MNCTFFTVYETRKRVRIREPWLAISYRAFQLVFVAKVLYEIVWNLKFMKCADVESKTTFNLFNPLSNNESCLTGAKTLKEFKGCTRKASCTGHNCIAMHSRDMQFIRPGDAFLVPWEVGVARGRGQTVQHFEVAEFEKYTLHVRHSFRSATLADDENYGLCDDSHAYVQFQDLHQEELRCLHLSTFGHTKEPMKLMESQNSISKEQIMARTRHGDVLSLKGLFEAANSSFADFKDRSLTLVLKVVYTNLDPYDFWFDLRSFGAVPKYTYVPSVLEMGPQEIEVGRMLLNEMGPEAILYEATGLLIFIQYVGSVGAFSFLKLVTFLGASMGLFALARVAIDMVVVFLLGKFKRTAHMKMLFDMARYEDSPRGAEVHEILCTTREPDDTIAEALQKAKTSANREQIKGLAADALQHRDASSDSSD